MSAPTGPQPKQAMRWLSREFSELLAQLASGAHRADRPEGAPDFDLLIVGSGYGGAVAAAEFAGCVDQNGAELRIGVLERGIEYLPGAFPSRLAELPRKVRGSLGARVRGGEGLFDVRMDGDVGVVLGNGLGGGSLINAGVMERPHPAVFGPDWPLALQRRTALDPFLDEAATLLGAEKNRQRNTIGAHAGHQAQPLAKHKALLRFAGASDGNPAPKNFRDAAITVAMADKATAAGVKLKACTLCGDCATGCNHAAKESLDTHLLVDAFRCGAEIYCGATVLRVERDGAQAWRVLAVHTEPAMRLREGEPRWIRAAKVVLAAGALGSTEILLRSQRASSALSFSPMLGRKFSGNGDMLAFGYDQFEANAFADETGPPGTRHVGPTITGVVELPAAGDAPIVIEEMAVPGPIRRLAEEMLVTSNTLHELGTLDASPHSTGHPGRDAYAVHANKIRRTSVFAAMGDDGAGGELRLKEHRLDLDGDGHIQVVWPEAKDLPLFDRQIEAIEAHAEKAGWKGQGRIIPNPLWRLLPKSMDFILSDRRGPLLTVHPLGGCRMADTVDAGVVSEFGAVFDGARPGQHHEGLYVLDGSVLPSALSINPALTITALALRAVRTWKTRWEWQSVAFVGPLENLERPRIREVVAAPHAPVKAQFTERLASGPMIVRDARSKPQRCVAEITLSFETDVLSKLFAPSEDDGSMRGAVLNVGAGEGDGRSVLRLFHEKDWQEYRLKDLSNPQTERERNARAASYALEGSLTILGRERSSLSRRVRRAGWAWWRNRGARDIWQAGERWIEDRVAGHLHSGPGIGERALGAWRLASRAGEVRLFEYRLKVGAKISGPDDGFELTDAMREEPIVGRKRITYDRPSNPWRQLQEMTLQRFPAWTPSARPVVFALDSRFLAQRLVPLFRLAEQGDHSDALMDVISLGAYFARMLLSIHIWTARKPDAPRPRELRRLPGRLPGLPEPEVHEIEVDRLGTQPVHVRLTRYRRERRGAPARQASAGSVPRPIVTLHGYSASGTTFAHPSNPTSLAQYFARDLGGDVWVVDLRTSCGMPTATHPWTFERVAMIDVPAAIDYVCARTGAPQVDVVAHCMGAAMLSMAVLWSRKGCGYEQRLKEVLTDRDDEAVDRFRVAREALPGRIANLALSQIGPVMVFSPANVFRAFLTSFLEQVLGPLPYRFRPEPGEGLGSELLDRLLATMPYPDEELLAENPSIPWARREWVGSRHRMDALYGADFKLANLDNRQLDHLDDFFGPLSLDTVAQGIHLARELSVTNREGRNRFVSRDSLRVHWKFPTLSVHGVDNGLADVSTLARMQKILAQDAGCAYRAFPLENCGHQDSLIGRYAKDKTFPEIARFFRDGGAMQTQTPDPFAAPPWLGPMLQFDAAGQLWVGVGAAPGLGRPQYMCLIPVQCVSGKWTRMNPSPVPARYVDEPPEHVDGDWLWMPLPSTWCTSPGVRYVLPLLFYDQSDRMGGAAAGLNPWSRERSRLMLRALRGEPGHGDGEQLKEPDDIAVHKSLGRAIDAALARLPEETLLPRRRKEVTTKPGPCDDIPLGVLCLDACRVESQGLKIALGSCQYPPGILDRWPAYAAWERFTPQPQLLILTGDQIYADASAGLFDAALMEDRYRKPHEAWLRSPQVRELLRRVPTVTLLDDHEIDDGWEPWSPGPDAPGQALHQRRRAEGELAFRRFQRPPDPLGKPLWHSFERGGASFFLLDTRLQRSVRGAASTDSARLIDDAQLAALKSWLIDTDRADKPKLIVSPALFLPRHVYAQRAALAYREADRGSAAALRSDAWSGYPRSAYELLAFVCEHDLRHVVFLSGDEHLGLVARIEITPGANPSRGVTLTSIHSPGLYSPFSFANGSPHDFAAHDTFGFSVADPAGTAQAYTCDVSTTVMEGNGLVEIDLSAAGRAWNLAYRFDQGRGAQDASDVIGI